MVYLSCYLNLPSYCPYCVHVHGNLLMTNANGILFLSSVNYHQVMPGLLLCFVLRYDAYKRSQVASCEAGIAPPNHLNKITYFHCSLIGYFFGELVEFIIS